MSNSYLKDTITLLTACLVGLAGIYLMRIGEDFVSPKSRSLAPSEPIIKHNTNIDNSQSNVTESKLLPNESSRSNQNINSNTDEKRQSATTRSAETYGEIETIEEQTKKFLSSNDIVYNWPTKGVSLLKRNNELYSIPKLPPALNDKLKQSIQNLIASGVAYLNDNNLSTSDKEAVYLAVLGSSNYNQYLSELQQRTLTKISSELQKNNTHSKSSQRTPNIVSPNKNKDPQHIDATRSSTPGTGSSSNRNSQPNNSRPQPPEAFRL